MRRPVNTSASCLRALWLWLWSCSLALAAQQPIITASGSDNTPILQGSGATASGKDAARSRLEADDVDATSATLDTATLTTATADVIDITETTDPGAPGADALRLWVGDEGGHSVLHQVDDTGLDREIGRDIWHVVRNVSGAALAVGDVVYISGSNGVYPTVAAADADAAGTMPAFGLVATAMSNNSFGIVFRAGDLTGIDTSSWSEGIELYVSQTAGALTATAPTAPALQQVAATVVKSAAGAAGILSVTIGTELGAVDEGYIPAAITRDTEWDTEAEVEAVWGTGIHTTGEGALDDDDLSDNDTDDLAEGASNLYYTDARARAAITESVTGLEFSSGDLQETTGYSIPTDADIALIETWDGSTGGNFSAGTGRTSLGLGALATLGAVSGGVGGTITDGTITADDLAANSVGSSEIAAGAVNPFDLEAGAGAPTDGYAPLASFATTDFEWIDVIEESELDSEAELEAQLIGVTDVYTNNDFTDNSTNWDTAYSDRLKWDGGATGLNASTGRTSLGLGALATLSSITDPGYIDDDAVGQAEIADGAIDPARIDATGGVAGRVLSYVTSAAGAWIDVLTPSDIGSSVQAYDEELSEIAGLAPSNGDVLYYNGALFEWGATSPGSGSGVQAWDADLDDLSDGVRTVNSTGAAGFTFENTNSGTSAFTYLRMGNDADDDAGLLRNGSATVSYSGARSLSLYQLGPYPISIITNNLRRATYDGNGNYAFNDDSRDQDFRVESDNDVYAIFMEGSTGLTAFGDSSPTEKLEVSAANAAGDTSIALRNSTTTDGSTAEIKMRVTTSDVDGVKLVASRTNGSNIYFQIWNLISGSLAKTFEIGSGGAIYMPQLSTGSGNTMYIDTSTNEIYDGTSTGNDKDLIEAIDDELTTRMASLEPKTFLRKGTGNREYYYIAEEVAAVMPEAVNWRWEPTTATLATTSTVPLVARTDGVPEYVARYWEETLPQITKDIVTTYTTEIADPNSTGTLEVVAETTTTVKAGYLVEITGWTAKPAGVNDRAVLSILHKVIKRQRQDINTLRENAIAAKQQAETALDNQRQRIAALEATVAEHASALDQARTAIINLNQRVSALEGQ